ncbi:hypothetical protein Pint_26208 [Pistacia integerrima]|uniref:Uncharacterized protein n=1 Tax=Pistacia integerrima TaxID=434235 RepID=A0ACC0YE76_9ROSI|nr:hypothetical protein Pint_26208 [Pistacia integerrima]
MMKVTAIVCDRGRIQRRLSHEAANGLDFGCNASGYEWPWRPPLREFLSGLAAAIALPQHCDCIGRAFATRLMPLCVCSTSPELLLNPVMADELENILTKKFFRILSMRADAFQVLRRKPLQVYGFILLLFEDIMLLGKFKNFQSTSEIISF